MFIIYASATYAYMQRVATYNNNIYARKLDILY